MHPGNLPEQVGQPSISVRKVPPIIVHSVSVTQLYGLETEQGSWQLPAPWVQPTQSGGGAGGAIQLPPTSSQAGSVLHENSWLRLQDCSQWPALTPPPPPSTSRRKPTSLPPPPHGKSPHISIAWVTHWLPIASHVCWE